MSRVLDVVGGKWRMNILWIINKHKKVRFNQLRREVEGITTISLTRGLDVLIEKQLVEKYDYLLNDWIGKTGLENTMERFTNSDG